MSVQKTLTLSFDPHDGLYAFGLYTLARARFNAFTGSAECIHVVIYIQNPSQNR